MSDQFWLTKTIPDHMDYPADHTPVVHARNATRPREKECICGYVKGEISFASTSPAPLLATPPVA